MTLRSAQLSFLLIFTILAAAARAQDVRITEFQAVNVSGIVDENNSQQGWIEIWNPSTTTPMPLSLWKLTNGTTTWTFPSVIINPDEFMIIWASGKNRTVVTAPLHTNFTLPAEGGTVSLLRSNNTAASTIASYPAQTADTSWGRDEWDVVTTPTQVGKYTTPTPGKRNNFSGSGVAGKVIFDKLSQSFTGTLVLTLSKEIVDPAAVIRYTTNGAVPTATSAVFTVPLNVTTTQMIRARIYKPGLLPGETETQCYLLRDATTTAFSSAMPIIVISNFGQGQPPDAGDQNGFAWVWEPASPDNRSRLTNMPTLATRIAIDRRGSSTINNAKYNLNMEARRARNDEDRDISLLGMPDGSDYVMSGPYDFDRSEIHNPFIYALSNQIGRYAPRTRLAEVFMKVNAGALNFSGTGNDYYGIYNVMEKIRRDKNRVDIHKLDTYDNDAVGKTGGFIWKVDRKDSGDDGFSAGGQGFAYYYPKEVELELPQRDPQEQFLSTYINSFNTALQSPTWNNPTTGYAAFLDVPAAIDHHLLNLWPMNVDAFRLSGYWHKERGGKLIAGPIWDFDRAMESTDSRDDFPAAWIGGGDATPFFTYTWWNRLFADIEFYQKYIDRWQSLRRGAFSAANVNALLDSLNAQMSAEAINRDVARWSLTKRAWTRPFSPFTAMPASQAAEVQRIKDWLQQRANFFDSQWVGPVTASLAEGNVAAGTQVTLIGPVGVPIHYTLDGADPRPTGGAAPGVATLYTGPITINATTRIRARAYKSNHTALVSGTNPPLLSKWSGLTNVRYSTDTPAASGNLVVTEINYHPANPSAAELVVNPVFADSDFEFIELRNLGATPIDLGGAQFTAGVTFAFTGDNALTLAPGAYVVVVANPSAFAARNGAGATVVGPFTGNLDNGGEQITLKAANNTTILDFTYDDAWYPTSDGNGRTLVIYDPYAPPGAFST
ncbi:MAG: CotH kinase family protein, partial [Chthoniobacteraceae bacterium]